MIASYVRLRRRHPFDLCAGLADAGLAAGLDHDVIGFDDVMNSQIFRPRLTSVATRPWRLGEFAAHRMLNRLADKQSEPRVEILPTS